MASDPDVKRAERALEEALRAYLVASGSMDEGEILTAWGAFGASTTIEDDGPVYRTWSFPQPDGVPPYTVVGILGIEYGKWRNYMVADDAADPREG